jgi:hypothetical protein
MLSALAVLSAATACGNPEPANAPAPAEPAAPQPQKPAPADPAPPKEGGPVAEDPSFVLKIDGDMPYVVGNLATFAISLVPKGEYHVNEDFPIRIEITAPAALTMQKKVLEKPDAATFSEKNARFDVPFTAGAVGKHHVVANVKFAVCTPQTCIPDERTLSWDMDVVQ